MKKYWKWILAGLGAFVLVKMVQGQGLTGLQSTEAPNSRGDATYSAYRKAWDAARKAGKPYFYVWGAWKNIVPLGRGRYIYQYQTVDGQYVNGAAWWPGNPLPDPLPV